MNLWPIVLVGSVAILANLLNLTWPFFQSMVPGTPEWRLLGLVGTMSGVADISGRITLAKEGGESTEFLIQCIRTLAMPGPKLALRLELWAPEELRGEIYTLREIETGWLLVHYRPNEKTGIESRLTSPAWQQTLAQFNLPRLRQAIWWRQVIVAQQEGVVELWGRFGPFHYISIHLDLETNLPSRIRLHSDEEMIEISISEIKLNQGLELRDLLQLPEQPEVWIQG